MGTTLDGVCVPTGVALLTRTPWLSSLGVLPGPSGKHTGHAQDPPGQWCLLAPGLCVPLAMTCSPRARPVLAPVC